MTATTDRRLERAAVALAEVGYYVFPCRPRTKEPFAGTHGWQDATRDERQILQWWERWPDANIGIACGKSGIVALDIDSKYGADPREVIPSAGLDGHPIVWTGEAPERSAKLPDSLEGARGAHVIFRGNLATGKTPIPGVELRGEGAYIVAPPSVHPSGVPYEGGLPPVAELPAAAAIGLDQWIPATSANGSAAVPDDDAEIEQGGRHEALLAWARSRYTAKGVLGQAALDGMRGYNARALKPPLPDEEVKRLWKYLEGTKIAASERAKEAESDAVPRPTPLKEMGRGTSLFTTRGVDLSKLRPVRFAWKPWLIHGRLNLFAGEEASGKSTLQAWLTAKVTRGELPGEFEGKPGWVLYVGADEDDWNEIVAPRLYAVGADLGRVREFVPVDDAAVFNAVDHIAELDRELQTRSYALVVFEQLMDVLPKLRNPNDPMELRQSLRPLRRVLAAREVTGLGTLHVNKALVDQLRQRMQGSMQFGALSRSTVLVDKHPSEEGRRIAVLGKANYVEKPIAMSFTIEPRTFDLNGVGFNVGAVADVRDDDATVDEVLARGRGEREKAHDDKRDAVADALTDVPQTVRAIADAADVARSTTDRILKELADEDLAVKTDDGWLSHVPRPLRERDMGQAGQTELLEPPDRTGDHTFDPNWKPYGSPAEPDEREDWRQR